MLVAELLLGLEVVVLHVVELLDLPNQPRPLLFVCRLRQLYLLLLLPNLFFENSYSLVQVLDVQTLLEGHLQVPGSPGVVFLLGHGF